ncbi:MAG: IS1595 family transposase [Hyphomicrobiales bacterium]|nr:IS1595 family transposase [Hyphomicrobiales bacterium]
MFDLTATIYTDQDAAREHLEAIQWPEGPVCPHCGNVDQDRITKLKGKSTRPGVYKCKECRKPFSVTVGTVFERSHVPLNKWVLATHLMAASKKGMSAHQLHRMLGVTYKTAWFMSHRIREAMRDDNPTPMGGSGKTVEADETYFGNVKGSRRKDVLKDGKWVKRGGGTGTRYKIVSLVERNGRARSVHVPSLTANTVRKVLVTNTSRKSDLMTDESNVYPAVGREFASHDTVNHGAGEYGRGLVHTNTIEGFFSIFKRGMKGVYQHCSEAHLHRYLTEFDFRYSNRIALKVDDAQRAEIALKGIRGKRLTYRRTNEARYA